jgi:hypothetical protein
VHEEVIVRHAGLQPTQAQHPHCRPPAASTRPPDQGRPPCARITDEASPFALRSTESSEDSNAPGCDPFFERPVTTGDPEAFVHRVRPSSVSTVPSLCHAQPRMGVTAEAAELGRCGAEHGAGGHCVGAALASHVRSHAPAAGSAPRSRSRRCDSPHDPDSTGYREGRSTSEAASASVERRSWSSAGFEYEILCSTTSQQTSVNALPLCFRLSRCRSGRGRLSARAKHSSKTTADSGIGLSSTMSRVLS